MPLCSPLPAQLPNNATVGKSRGAAKPGRSSNQLQHSGWQTTWTGLSTECADGRRRPCAVTLCPATARRDGSEAAFEDDDGALQWRCKERCNSRLVASHALPDPATHHPSIFSRLTVPCCALLSALPLWLHGCTADMDAAAPTKRTKRPRAREAMDIADDSSMAGAARNGAAKKQKAKTARGGGSFGSWCCR